MEDISQLRSRVEAAKQRVTTATEEQQKYGLRLDDVARIVEGSLSRQRGELEAARNKAAKLQEELEAAETKLSQIEPRSTALAAQSIQFAAQNEQLRGMVMTLLQLVEGRSTIPMTDALQRIERGLHGFLVEQQVAAAAPAPKPTPSAADEDDLLVDINAEPADDIAAAVAEPAVETSPVAELIRRISEETEEIAPPAQRKA